MHRLSVAIVLLVALLLSGCQGERGAAGPVGPAGPQGPEGASGNPDKQIRFPIVGFGVSAWAQGTALQPYLYKFDKRNYIGVDSITYVATLMCEDSTTACLVELYNFTDNVPIGRSRLLSSRTTSVVMESQNLYDVFPEKEITLGLRLQAVSSTPGKSVYVHAATLFLFRR